MRYLHALAASHTYRKLMKAGSFVILIPIVGLLATGYHILQKRGLPISEFPPDLLRKLVILVALTLGAHIFMTVLQRRQAKLAVEIDQSGVRHLAPGRERFIPWAEVTAVKQVYVGRSQNSPGRATMQLIYPGGKYRFDPYLMPDYGSVKISFNWRGWKWQMADGTTAPFDLIHTAGYQAIRRYRDDLLTGVKIK